MKKEWIYLIFKKFWKLQFIIFLLVAFHTILTLIDPYLIKILIDEAIIPKNFKKLIFVLIFLTFFLVLRHLINVIAGYFYTYAGSKISFYLREIILLRFISGNILFLDKYKKGDILSRVNEDIQNLESFFTQSFIDILMNSLSIIIIYFFLFLLNWKLAIITIIILPFAPLSMRIFRKKIQKVSKEEREISSEHFSFWENILGGLKEIAIYKLKDFLSKRFYEIAKISIYKKTKLQFLRMGSGLIGEVISTFILFPVIFGIGSYLILKGEFTIGGLISFHTYTLRVMFPLLFLFRLQILISTLKSSIERIDEIYNISFKKEKLPAKSKLDIENLNSIIFYNVSFQYDEKGEEVLKDVSFKIPFKKWTCIVGEIGSGKTTIIYLLLKLIKPQKGKIYIDDIPFDEINEEVWYENLSYVSQFPFLFNLSIEDNILLGAKKDKKFYEIVNLLGLNEILDKSKKDAREKFGEIYEKFSGGEKQKICIARALYKNYHILILDEPTSYMDIHTEMDLLKKLKDLQNKEGRTIIFVSHRFAPLLYSDHIIFISNGLIKAEGNLEELREDEEFIKMMKKIANSTPEVEKI